MDADKGRLSRVEDRLLGSHAIDLASGHCEAVRTVWSDVQEPSTLAGRIVHGRRNKYAESLISSVSPSALHGCESMLG
jgi:hypothetical protein